MFYVGTILSILAHGLIDIDHTTEVKLLAMSGLLISQFGISLGYCLLLPKV